MKRMMVYSHDTYGLGNIRRMLAICEHLLETIPNLTILLISGSPMIHSFRLPKRLDYIKLPCLTRTEREGYAVKSIGASLPETVTLRADLIRHAVAHFQPEVFLVDKKPYGVEDELRPALTYQQQAHPTSKRVLVLRDILDSPEATCEVWTKRGYHDAILSLYDEVWVVGSAEIFDLAKEYRFPAAVADKLRYCGYIRRSPPADQQESVTREEKHILVTSGGGADGYRLLEAYLMGSSNLPAQTPTRSLVICGPEMPAAQRDQLALMAARFPHVQLCEFTDNMLARMSQADVVVSMAGYNTICELLSLQKKAVIVPRARPVEEQWIRASRMAHSGLFQVLHPDQLTPSRLMDKVTAALSINSAPFESWYPIDLDALPRIAQYLEPLLSRRSDRVFNATQRQEASIAAAYQGR